MSDRKVMCSKLGREAEGLDAPPFPGALGQEIFDHVSAEAWAQWKEGMMIKIINEYRLNMASPADFDVLVQQMRAFLNLSAGDVKVADVENAERGRSGKEE